MQRRSFGAALALTALAVVLSVPAGAQPASDVPRLPDGTPDLQGVWDFRTLTPLQRPDDRADQAELTAEEAAEIEAAAVQRAVEADRPSEIRTEPLPVGGNVGGYNNFWFDRGAGVVDDRRTSLIVDPPDGRLPETRPGVERQGDGAEPAWPVRIRVGASAPPVPRTAGSPSGACSGSTPGPPSCPAATTRTSRSSRPPTTWSSSTRWCTTRASCPSTAGRRSPTTCGSGWAARAGAGRATLSSSRPPTSPPTPPASPRPPGWPSARARRCTS